MILKNKKYEEILKYIVGYVYNKGFSDGSNGLTPSVYVDHEKLVKEVKEELEEEFNIKFE